MSTDLFHKAARDGYLDLLREATRKDCNLADEDGMTPTMWASFYGNVDALRLIVARGGNPDKCDLFGSTALHHASANGHMNCVSFLVQFGANVWALDNDFHTALDIAAINDKGEIMRYLDSVVAKQSALNKKFIKKLKEKAVLDAQKRIKKFNKMQEKAQKRLEREDQRLAKEREKMGLSMDSASSSSSAESASPTSSLGGSTIRSRAFTKSSTISSRSLSKLNFSQPKPYSEHFDYTGRSSGKFTLGGVARRINKKKCSQTNGTSEFKVAEREADGKRTIKSLAGLRRDEQVMYVGGGGRGGKMRVEDLFLNNETDAESIPYSEPAFQTNGKDTTSDSEHTAETVSIFERPGFGSVAFLRRPTPNSLMALAAENGAKLEADRSVPALMNGHERSSRRGSFTDSIGTLGSLAARVKDLPWGEEEVQGLDDDEDEGSPLELFLVTHGLADYLNFFAKEQVDLDALLLLKDADLKELGVPLGPRKKLLDAIERRKDVMQKPGAIQDTPL